MSISEDYQENVRKQKMTQIQKPIYTVSFPSPLLLTYFIIYYEVSANRFVLVLGDGE